MCFSWKHHLSESNWPQPSVQVGQPRLRTGPNGSCLSMQWIESRLVFSLASLWCDDRNGRNSLQCIVDSVSLQEDRSRWQGSYENSAWERGFADVYTCVWVYVWEEERQRDTGRVYKTLTGRQAIVFISLKGPLEWDPIYQAPSTAVKFLRLSKWPHLSGQGSEWS